MNPVVWARARRIGASMVRAMRWLSIVSILGAAVGCGDNAPGPAMPDAKPGFMTAAHTPLPLLDAHDHVILDHVKLVTLTYSDYADAATVEAFGDAIPASNWFTNAGAEYGVGAGTHAAKYHLGPTPTTVLEDTTVEALISGLITAGSIPQPPATGNEFLYMIYIPPSVPLGASLQGGFVGYHTSITVGGIEVPYALILDDGSGIDNTEWTAAHELIEAATDPLFAPNPNGDGWYADKPLPDPWYMIEGEIADLCDGEATIHEGPFTVQRTWSNAAIMAGKAPCVPYEPDDAWMSVSAEPATMPTIAAGGSATFTLTGWSTKEMPDWSLATTAADYSDLTDQDLNAQLSATTINNGTTVTLTLHAPSTATSGQNGGVYVYSGAQQRPWAVGFTVQ
jgi:hypothetical protein